MSTILDIVSIVSSTVSLLLVVSKMVHKKVIKSTCMISSHDANERKPEDKHNKLTADDIHLP